MLLLVTTSLLILFPALDAAGWTVPNADEVWDYEGNAWSYDTDDTDNGPASWSANYPQCGSGNASHPTARDKYPCKLFFKYNTFPAVLFYEHGYS